MSNDHGHDGAQAIVAFKQFADVLCRISATGNCSGSMHGVPFRQADAEEFFVAAQKLRPFLTPPSHLSVAAEGASGPFLSLALYDNRKGFVERCKGGSLVRAIDEGRRRELDRLIAAQEEATRGAPIVVSENDLPLLDHLRLLAEMASGGDPRVAKWHLSRIYVKVREIAASPSLFYGDSEFTLIKEVLGEFHQMALELPEEEFVKAGWDPLRIRLGQHEDKIKKLIWQREEAKREKKRNEREAELDKGRDANAGLNLAMFAKEQTPPPPAETEWAIRNAKGKSLALTPYAFPPEPRGAGTLIPLPREGTIADPRTPHSPSEDSISRSAGCEQSLLDNEALLEMDRQLGGYMENPNLLVDPKLLDRNARGFTIENVEFYVSSPNHPLHGQAREALELLCRWGNAEHRWVQEGESFRPQRILRPPAMAENAPATDSPGKIVAQKKARAAGLFVLDPENNRSIRSIADEVGLDHSVIRRDPELKRIIESREANVQVAKSHLPRGSKSEDGGVDSWDQE